jgi:hypothetical protein
MRSQSATEEDRTIGLAPAIKPTMPWRVAWVEALPNYRLRVVFMDGVAGIVDAERLINSDTAGVFASLRDPLKFAEVGVELGAVTWPSGLDLVPDAIHRAIKTSGECILR